MAQSRRSLVCHSCCSFVTLAAGRRCCLAPLPAPPSLSAGVGIACWPSVFLVALLSHWLLAGVAVWPLSPRPSPFLLVLALLVGLLSFLLLFCSIGCWLALLCCSSPRAPLLILASLSLRPSFHPFWSVFGWGWVLFDGGLGWRTWLPDVGWLYWVESAHSLGLLDGEWLDFSGCFCLVRLGDLAGYSLLACV